MSSPARPALQDNELFGGAGDVHAALLGEHDHVLNAHAEPSGQVDPRLGGQQGPGGNGLVVPVVEAGVLVDLDAQGVAEAVAEVVPVARVGDNLGPGLVDLLAGDSGPGNGDARQLGLDGNRR